MNTKKRVLGTEHPSTLTSIDNVASTYRDLGRLTEAEDLFVPIVETKRRVFGAEHPSTLTGTVNLAQTWRMQEKEQEALNLMQHTQRYLALITPR